ncbi:hypothetical protein Taro_009380 [Colocasia esculenta]|uniref:Serine/threonine-protein kinase 11-interacting protein n=1 Tax=Colocasia esculenta TaxID=4460 RepID=A0A843TZY2_COLES|nr:hypothetical protein [Colocasia esculenta]
MAIVTGDRYLDSLVRFVERNAGPLLEGVLTLKLNPVGLHYVQSRLEALEELERLRAGAPVDYLRAYVSDLGDHRALEQLRRILRLLPSLKVISVLPPPARDPTPLSLLPFGRLKVLELRGCDLSSSTARGLLELRHTLEKLICHNSTDALRHLFASRIVDIKDSPAWNKLSFVSCACNGLVLMDESLQLLPAVETLDLSRNQFAKVDNLRKCTKLHFLDLGFNHLRTVSSLSEVLCPIIKLVLRNNALTTLRGIENLKSVEGLDLSYNILSSFSELEVLASLLSLQNVWLEGNPICCARWYRAHIFSFFSHPEKVKLDEKGISTGEYWERHLILVSRHKRPAGCGFYFPAKENASNDIFANTKRKKISRLASIEDEEQRRYFCAENVDQESASCDSDNLKKDEPIITDNEAEIIDLMNRVESMKKEQSVLWLRDFREWLDQPTEEDLNFNSDIRKYTKQKDGGRHLGKCPVHVKDILQTSKGECSINFLDSDLPPSDTSIHGQKMSYSNGKAVMNHPLVDKARFRTGRMDSGLGQLEVCCKGPLNSVPLEKNNPLSPTNSMFEIVKETEGRKKSTPLTAIEEIMESRQSSLSPGSPPHYQEDILHHRQNLEDESLQLSADSYSEDSSDSDTSCSDDESCKFSYSFSGLEQLLNEESLKRSIGNHSSAFQLNADSPDARVKDISRFLDDASAESYSSTLDPSTSNNGEQLPMCGMVDSSNDDVKITSKDIADRRKSKLKPKRRILPFLDGHCLDANKDITSKESNGILEVPEADIEDRDELLNCTVLLPENLQDKMESLVWNPDGSIISSNSSKSAYLKDKPSSLGAPDVPIEKYFFKNLADSEVSETCEQLIYCDCIIEEGSDYQEKNDTVGLRILMSGLHGKDRRPAKSFLSLKFATTGWRLFFLHWGNLKGGCSRSWGARVGLAAHSGMTYKVLGCHRLKEIKEVVIGLDLQTARIQFEGDVSYMFLVRSTEKLEKLLHVLHLCDSSAINSGCSIKRYYILA